MWNNLFNAHENGMLVSCLKDRVGCLYTIEYAMRVYGSKQIVYTNKHTHTQRSYLYPCDVLQESIRNEGEQEKGNTMKHKTFYGYKNVFIDTVYNLVHTNPYRQWYETSRTRKKKYEKRCFHSNTLIHRTT